MLPNERTSFGFKDGISHPDIEGSGIPPTNPREEPFKAGEFVLGYPDENGDLPPAPEPEALGRTAATSSSASSRPAWRRSASTSVPAPRVEPRRSCWPPSSSAAGRAARRWCLLRSATIQELGADPKRNNAFLYAANDDARGLKCPLDAHARRTYPRESTIVGVARFHRMIRRSSSYGPMLPKVS